MLTLTLTLRYTRTSTPGVKHKLSFASQRRTEMKIDQFAKSVDPDDVAHYVHKPETVHPAFRYSKLDMLNIIGFCLHGMFDGIYVPNLK